MAWDMFQDWLWAHPRAILIIALSIVILFDIYIISTDEKIKK